MRLLDGFALGHWSDPKNHTGCSVILCPPGTAASCEVRGSSPGSRELALLAPEKKMEEIHALLFTGGSAFGLAAADGVVQWLEEHQRGYPTPWGVVPIVPAAVIFDLNVGSWTVRPDSASGRAACDAASDDPTQQGSVGAGTGATVGKWGGMEGRMMGGFGMAETLRDDLRVQVLAVVNAVGDVIDPQGSVLAGARAADGFFRVATDPSRSIQRTIVPDRTNTTLVAALTNARLTKVQCYRVAQRMHDGLARAIQPVHTSFDGDVTFALACGTVSADFDVVAEAAAAGAVEAIRAAVTHADALPGIPSVQEFRHTR